MKMKSILTIASASIAACCFSHAALVLIEDDFSGYSGVGNWDNGKLTVANNTDDATLGALIGYTIDGSGQGAGSPGDYGIEDNGDRQFVYGNNIFFSRYADQAIDLNVGDTLIFSLNFTTGRAWPDQFTILIDDEPVSGTLIDDNVYSYTVDASDAGADKTVGISWNTGAWGETNSVKLEHNVIPEPAAALLGGLGLLGLFARRRK